jgi:SAM-dependent methyltransferase
VSSNRIDLYNTAYAHYANDVEAAVRKETYGEDIGQSSWITAAEWLRFARRAALQEWWRVLRPGGRMLFTDAMERRLSRFSYLAAKPLPS